MNNDGQLTVTFSGQNPFLIDDSEFKISYDVFHTLYICWNLDSGEIKYGLNNNELKTFSFPSNFSWDNFDTEWTIQHPGFGTAFTGEIDYVLDVNDYLTKDQMNSLVSRHHK